MYTGEDMGSLYVPTGQSTQTSLEMDQKNLVPLVADEKWIQSFWGHTSSL